MSKSSEQWFRISQERLARLAGQGTHQGSQQAWESCRVIAAAGGSPVAFYSEFSGFRVFNERDQNGDKIRQLFSIKQRSKEWRG